MCCNTLVVVKLDCNAAKPVGEVAIVCHTAASVQVSKEADVAEIASDTTTPSHGPLGPIALALSGGGYRAAAFHLGTLRTLHEAGLLQSVDVLSTV
ncbi:MAG: hypothetical protein ABI614_24120, partial [Planctomycetota bacterium]